MEEDKASARFEETSCQTTQKNIVLDIEFDSFVEATHKMRY